MADNYFSDRELIQIMREEDPTTDNRAYVQLSEDPSVKTAIGALLWDSESRNVAVDYLRLRSFQSLTAKVRSKKFEETHKGETSLVKIYINIFGNLLIAEPIRTGQEPQSDRLLKGLYKNPMVINTIKAAVKNYPLLKAQEILDEGFSKLYENIYEAKYDGRGTLRTYFIGICKGQILESGSSGRIKNESGGETRQVKRTISADTFDAFDFDESDDGSGADFIVELEEKSDEEQLLERIVENLLDSDAVSVRCREALVLRYIEELSLAQVAEKMNIAYQSAKNQAKPCREELDKAIKSIGGLEAFLRESFNIKRKKDSGN